MNMRDLQEDTPGFTSTLMSVLRREPEAPHTPSSHEQTRALYDRLAHWYDRIAGAAEYASIEAGLTRLALRAGERALDVGCGTGSALLRIASQVGERGLACGVDISPRMCAIARRKASASPERAWVHIQEGDATALPYADGTFDAVFMSFTLEVFDTSEIPRVLAECRRVLRPGGRICIVSLSARTPYTQMTRLYLRARAMLPHLVDCRPIHPADAVHSSHFLVEGAEERMMWGMPVEVAIAHSVEVPERRQPILR